MDVRDVISRGPFVEQIDLAPAKAQICKASDKQAFVSFLLFCEKLRCTNSFAITQGLDLFKLVQFNRRIKNSYRDRLDESTSLKLSVYDNPSKIFKFPLEFATKLETAITLILGQPRVHPFLFTINHSR